MKIYDCFIFNHEIELLEIRLNILDKFVDKFIITEGDSTFSGFPKDSHYLRNKDRFKKWEDKIIHNPIKIPDMKGPWDREIYSRNAMLDLEIFEDNDLLIMSDSDEIPNPLIIKDAPNWISSNKHFTLKQSCYAYWINNLYSNNWFGSRIATYKYMKNKKADDVREATELESELTGAIITNGGWHFTYLGGEEQIRKKINSFCDRQFDVPKITENISDNLSQGRDVFNRTHIKYKRVDLDDSFPVYLIKNYKKYSHLIKFESDNKALPIIIKKSLNNKKYYIKNLKPNLFKKYYVRFVSKIKKIPRKIKSLIK